ncbi:MAG: hypothetical protein ACXWJZ_18025 [Burkholderiaceae bacterium]
MNTPRREREVSAYSDCGAVAQERKWQRVGIGSIPVDGDCFASLAMTRLDELSLRGARQRDEAISWRVAG